MTPTETTHLQTLERERDALARELAACQAEYARVVEEAKKERGDLLADVGCYVATRKFWPLSLREAIKRHDIDWIRAETERADAIVEQWLRDSHALSAAEGQVAALRDTLEAIRKAVPCERRVNHVMPRDGCECWRCLDVGQPIVAALSATRETSEAFVAKVREEERAKINDAWRGMLRPQEPNEAVVKEIAEHDARVRAAALEEAAALFLAQDPQLGKGVADRLRALVAAEPRTKKERPTAPTLTREDIEEALEKEKP